VRFIGADLKKETKILFMYKEDELVGRALKRQHGRKNQMARQVNSTNVVQ